MYGAEVNIQHSVAVQQSYGETHKCRSFCADRDSKTASFEAFSFSVHTSRADLTLVTACGVETALPQAKERRDHTSHRNRFRSRDLVARP